MEKNSSRNSFQQLAANDQSFSKAYSINQNNNNNELKNSETIGNSASPTTKTQNRHHSIAVASVSPMPQKGFPLMGFANQNQQTNSMRAKVRDFIEGRFVTIVMTFLTLFVLFGDDIRVWVVPKQGDIVFYILYLVSISLFTIELIILSITLDKYKYSFYFWLDIIATVSIVFDIPWIMSPIFQLFGSTYEYDSINADPANISKTSIVSSPTSSRIIRALRLTRLTRIVKLYKYCLSSQPDVSEAERRQQQKSAQNVQQATLNRELETKKLGRLLSDITTRRVILLVLIFIIVLPILGAYQTNFSGDYGLRQLFWFGRSDCTGGTSILCNQNDNWLKLNGWNQMLRQYSLSGRQDQSSSLEMTLLWMKVPNFANSGKVQEISSFTSGTYTWTQDSKCSGDNVNESQCDLRAQEMILYSFTPNQCNSQTSGCQQLISYARFSIKKFRQMQGLMSFIYIVFVIVALLLSSFTFTRDAQKIVIDPISKLVNIIKGLADRPLEKPEKTTALKHAQTMAPGALADNEEQGQIRTGMLKKTVNKVKMLMQLGFGHLGSIIIARDYLSAGASQTVQIMIPGRKIYTTILYCKIKNFTAVTQSLQQEAMVFLNKICHIVHECAVHWGGHVDKNLGDSFILTFLTRDQLKTGAGGLDIGQDDPQKNEELLQQRAQMANRALVTIIKIISEIRRAQDLMVYSKHPKIIARLGGQYRLQLSFGLHFGWAVQGAYGSDYRVDAGHISPHIEVAKRLQDLTADYGQSILISDSAYHLLSLKAKQGIRKIDVIAISQIRQSVGIYSYDLNNDFVPVMPAEESQDVGRLIRVQRYHNINVHQFDTQGVDYMFALDADILNVSPEDIKQFNPLFLTLFANYIQGDWAKAYELVQQCTQMRAYDGPTVTLRQFMSMYQYAPPPSWNGVRSIDDTAAPMDSEQSHHQMIAGSIQPSPDRTTKMEFGAFDQDATKLQDQE